MFEFFRSIRKNLLASSKTGKSLQHTLSEVILVIMGRLILRPALLIRKTRHSIYAGGRFRTSYDDSIGVTITKP